MTAFGIAALILGAVLVVVGIALLAVRGKATEVIKGRYDRVEKQYQDAGRTPPGLTGRKPSANFVSVLGGIILVFGIGTLVLAFTQGIN